MKKTLLCVVVVMLVAAMMTALVPASAAEDKYAAANDGDLLYTPDFTGDEYYKPALVSGDLTVAVDPADHGKATLSSTQDKTKSYWGGDITCLPLNEGTAYTVFFTATRETEACLGYFVDNQFGMYGYSYNQRFLNGSATLTGHATMKYADLGMDAEGNTLTAGTTSVQRYAVEVNGQLSTLRMYVMGTDGKWIMVDETVETEILVFYTDYLGIWFYQYYANQPVTVSDFSIYKGMTISGEKLTETTAAPETEAPPVTEAVTTKAPDKETTKAPDKETTAAPGTKAPDTAKPADSTTKAPDDKKSGCGSIVAGGAGMIMAAAAAVVCLKKKKK